MNSIERVKTSIDLQPVAPIVKGELMLDRSFLRRYLNWQAKGAVADTLSDIELIINSCLALKIDLVCLQSGGGLEPSLPLADIGRIGDEGLFVFWVVNGAFQRAMECGDTMSFLAKMADSPVEVGKELQRISGRVVESMKQGIDAGAHGIIIADDIAYRQSTYMSPAFIEQFLLPVWQKQVQAARALDVPVFLHSDGNLNAALPLIESAGFNGLQCMEPAAGMDLKAIKAQYGKKLCLMGNLDPSLLIEQPDGPGMQTQRDDLRRAVSELISVDSNDGGFIFGTCSGLHAGMSAELVHFTYQLASE